MYLNLLQRFRQFVGSHFLGRLHRHRISPNLVTFVECAALRRKTKGRFAERVEQNKTKKTEREQRVTESQRTDSHDHAQMERTQIDRLFQVGLSKTNDSVNGAQQTTKDGLRRERERKRRKWRFTQTTNAHRYKEVIQTHTHTHTHTHTRPKSGLRLRA